MAIIAVHSEPEKSIYLRELNSHGFSVQSQK